jgi:hypothetical protein
MKVTGFFANYAEVQNGLLSVVGGCWSAYTITSDRPDFAGSIVTLATTSRDERAGGPAVTVSLLPPGGAPPLEMVSELILPGPDPSGDEACTILVGAFRVTSPALGTWTLRTTCGDRVDETRLAVVSR